MKIQKGKLSTSNVVVIGVLLVLLYLVMPSDSKKKSSGGDTTESGEVVVSPSPATVIEPIPSTHAEDPAAISDTTAAASIDAPQQLAMRPILEIDEHRLQVLVTENPFRTSAALDASDLRSQDGPETMTEIPESTSVPSAPVEQQPTRISLIYTSSRGTAAAILNNQIVYPGSRTSNNARVLSVHPGGIELQQSHERTVDSM